MPDLSLDLRFFQYLLASAEHGSFRHAALALGVPQSMVSRRVALLEHRLGFALFERDDRVDALEALLGVDTGAFGRLQSEPKKFVCGGPRSGAKRSQIGFESRSISIETETVKIYSSRFSL